MANGLQNARIDQLPQYTAVKNGFYLPMRDMDGQSTVRVDVKEFLQTETVSSNFEWITDNAPGYAINEVVTHNGKWFQSLINNNLNNVPGVDPTKWIEINKAPSGLVMWQSGVYPQDLVLVVNEIGEDGLQLYRLDPDEPRPFVSSDFDAELLAGIWLPMYIPAKNEHFRGLYPSLAALQAAIPVARPGDFAGVDAGPGQPIAQYLWDEGPPGAWIPAQSDVIINDASYTQKGVVERATLTEIDNGANVGETSAPLFVAPMEYKVSKWRRIVAVQNITGAVSIDLSTAEMFILTLTGNVTSFTFTNEIVGKEYMFVFLQNTTYKTLVWAAAKFEAPFNNFPILTDPTTNGTSGPARSKDIVTTMCTEAGVLSIVLTPNMIRN